MADRTLNLSDLAASLQSQIESFKPSVEAQSVGSVLEVGDGIARVSGLRDAAASELVQFSNGTLGIAFNLEADNIGVIIVGEYQDIEEGQQVLATGRIARLDDTLTVTAELVDTSDGSVLWGEQYRSKETGILTIQEEMARQISEQLKIQFTVERGPVDNPASR